MFPNRYYPARMFAARYFPKIGATPFVELPYQGDATIYDQPSPTGSIVGGTALPSEYIYAD